MTLAIRVFLMLGAGSLLVACGGSSDGGSSGGAAPTATATIDSETAPAMVEAALGAALESGALQDLGGLAAPSGGTMSAAIVESGTSANGPTAEVQVGPEVIQCAVSGSISFSADIQNQETISAGDSFSFSFNNCDEGDESVLNGSFEFEVDSFTGDMSSEMFAMTVSITVTGFQVVEGGETATLDGDFTMSLDTNDALVTTVSISGNSLSVDNGVESASLSQFSSTVTVDPATGLTTMDISGFMMSSEFDGEIYYETTTPLQFGADGTPVTGEFVIEGANGASITVMFGGGDSVEMNLDTDGDGQTDEVIMTTWQELDS
jgi:hypothetical protein